MAVVVIDNRFLVDEADSTTGWTTSDSFNVYTTGPNPKELTANLGWATSQSEEYAYHTISSTDLTSNLVYVWTLVLGTEQTQTNGGRQIYLGDGTNARGYYVGGSDAAGFRHDTGEVNWQCYILDTANLPANYTQHQGTLAPTLTSITRIGVGYVVDSKSLGGGDNTFIDITFWGTGGLSIVGGTTSDRGTFAEIAAIDARNTNYGGTAEASGARSSGTAGSSYGIIRKLTSGVFGLSGSLTFGDAAEAADCYFEDDGVVVVFEARITSTYWYFDAEGTSGQTNVFNLSNSTIKSAGPTITADFSGGNIDTLTFNTVSFIDFGGAITFSNSADATGHSITGCTFQNCGQIDPGDVTFQNNIIGGYTGTLGSMLLDADGTTNWSNLSFIKGTGNHAIYITATGSYTLTNFTYSGYSGTGVDAAVYNNSGGSVTLTIDGGDTPSIRNGTGATTTIITSPVTTAIKTIDLKTGLPVQNVRILVYVTSAAAGFPYQDSVSITGTGTTATVTHTAHGLSTGDHIIINGANEPEYNGSYSITVTGANTYTYTTNETIGSSPATGTITATFAFISGLTDINGNISDSRAVSTNQPIAGWARKSSTSPYYQQGNITGTVDSSTGFNTTIPLALDE